MGDDIDKGGGGDGNANGGNGDSQSKNASSGGSPPLQHSKSLDGSASAINTEPSAVKTEDDKSSPPSGSKGSRIQKSGNQGDNQLLPELSLDDLEAVLHEVNDIVDGLQVRCLYRYRVSSKIIKW